jgi:uncharacterized protein YdaU (DUF1376 family)
MLCWRTPDCSIPNDPEWISKRLRVDGDTFQRVVAPVIAEFFKIAKARLFNPRLLREWDRINSTSKRRKEAGEKGGRPTKPLKQKDQDKSRAFSEQKQKESPASHLELDPEPDNRDTSLRSVSAPAAPKPSDQMIELMMVLDPIRAKAVVEHRKGFRGKFTPHAAQLLAKKFSKCQDPNAAADAMISNGWQGFEPEWMDRQVRGSPHGGGRRMTRAEELQEDLRRRIADDEQRQGREGSLDLEAAEQFPGLLIEHHSGGR